MLKHVYPGAQIPVDQLSLDAALSPSEHYRFASQLAPLRGEGILVAGLGNVVHNLRALSRTHDPLPLDWATRFSAAVRERIVASDHAWLANPEAWGGDGALSVPTPEHYLPLLYILALQRPDDDLVFLTDGIELGSISMLSVVVGVVAPP